MHVYCTVWCYLILGGAETWNLGHLQNLLPGSYQVLAGCPAFKGRSRCQDGRRWFVPAFRPAQLATNKMSLIYGSTHILPGIQTTVFGEIFISLSMINQMYKNMHGINEYIYIISFSHASCITHCKPLKASGHIAPFALWASLGHISNAKKARNNNIFHHDMHLHSQN